MREAERLRWIRCRPANLARTRVFCAAYAGGSAAVFRGWEGYWQGEIELCAIELPGHGTRWREQPCPRLLPLVRDLVEAVGPLLDRSFVLFGHSMGALIVYELAHALAQHGARADHVVVSACRAPHLPSKRPPIHNLEHSAFVKELQRFNGTPARLFEHELLDMLLPVLRADFEAIETYVYAPKPPLACAFTVIGGLDDQIVTRDELAAWRSHTSGSFTLDMVPGDHFFLRSAPHIVQRLEHIARQGAV